MESVAHILPSKIESYLKVLGRLYKKQNSILFDKIVTTASNKVMEGDDFNQWNGINSTGHAIILTVNEDLFFELMDKKSEYENAICFDLNKLHVEDAEYFSRVSIEIETKNSKYNNHAVIEGNVENKDMVRIWGNNSTLRIFLSHKVTIKKETKALKDALAKIGISSFVAHEDIHPTTQWQSEIENALFSMDVLVALLTKDFHESNWTDQEIGVALGREKLIIPVRLPIDPKGFISKYQGVSGCVIDKPDDIAMKIFNIIAKDMRNCNKLFDCALSIYADSSSFAKSDFNVVNFLSKFEELSSEQLDRLLEAFRNNGQNKHSWDGRDNLRKLLNKWTGQTWTIKNDDLVVEI